MSLLFSIIYVYCATGFLMGAFVSLGVLYPDAMTDESKANVKRNMDRKGITNKYVFILWIMFNFTFGWLYAVVMRYVYLRKNNNGTS